MRTIREGKKNGEEEERRLMYVAVTRAEKALFLTESEGYNISTKTNKYPSRFLAEIRRDLVVTEGVIVSTNKDCSSFEVRFDSGSTRTLRAAFLK